MHIAVASGKGGTGKTLLATNLAKYWSGMGNSATYIDADAEEPNGHLFLAPKIQSQKRFSVKVPTLKDGKCNGHKKCQEACAFNAILALKGEIVVFNELCHSCGACVIACPENAIGETDREIGTIAFGKAGAIEFISATLDVGEARVTPLIEGVVDLAQNMTGNILVDAPPGTSCSAMAATENADLLLLVTEPTPFGLHDLRLAVGMGRVLGKKLAAVINRSDLGDDKAKLYLEAERIPLVAEIPFDRRIATAYANSKLAVDEIGWFQESIAALADRLVVLTGEES